MQDVQVIIIEPDSTNQKILKDTIDIISTDIQIKMFSSLKIFFESYKKYIQSKKQNISEIKESENIEKNDDNNSEMDKIQKEDHFKNIKLIIADIEGTFNVEQNLWKKFLNSQEYQKEKNESPPRFLYTSYDRGDFDPYKYRSDVVYNILIKPLDLILVEQIIRLSLQPEGPLDVKTLYSQKQPGVIELIKDIEIERLTELGFRTKSRRPIEINKIARYFGRAFGDGNSQSLFAYCYANYESDKARSSYSSAFSYFGISKTKLASIRRLIQADKSKTSYPFPNEAGPQTHFIHTFILVSKDSELIRNFQNYIADKFINANILIFYNLHQLLQQVPPSIRKQMKSEIKESKIFEKDEAVVFKFNEDFSNLLDAYYSDTKSVVNSVFKLNREDWNHTSVFDRVLKDKDLKRLSKIFQDKKIYNSEVFELNLDGNTHFIKLLSIEELFDIEHGKVYLLSLKVLSEEEEYNEIKKNVQPIRAVHGFFLDDNSLKTESLSAMKQAIELILSQSPIAYKTFVFSKEAVEKYQQVETYQGIDDIFQLPLDVFYLTRKLKMHCASLELKNSNENSRLGIELRQGIKTAWPLTIESVSEVHISFKYPREIHIGDVRRLILPLESDSSVPEVLAICRFCEKISDQVYRCDFLFFAVKDTQLKHIRQWIKRNYVDEKNKSET